MQSGSGLLDHLPGPVAGSKLVCFMFCFTATLLSRPVEKWFQNFLYEICIPALRVCLKQCKTPPLLS